MPTPANNTDMARPADQALVFDQAPTGLDPSGFDPSRIRLNGFEVKALTALATAPSDHYWPFARIQEESGIPKMHVRRIVRLLARKGLARFASGLTNDDGELAGAGYQLTEAGRSLC